MIASAQVAQVNSRSPRMEFKPPIYNYDYALQLSSYNYNYALQLTYNYDYALQLSSYNYDYVLQLTSELELNLYGEGVGLHE